MTWTDWENHQEFLGMDDHYLIRSRDGSGWVKRYYTVWGFIEDATKATRFSTIEEARTTMYTKYPRTTYLEVVLVCKETTQKIKEQK